VRPPLALAPLAALALVVTLAAPPVAGAAEGERALSVGVDYMTWTIPLERQAGAPADAPTDLTAHGATAAVDYEYGWNDTLWLRASATGGWFVSDPGSNWAGGGTVGLTYALDVLRYVPVVQAGVGLLVLGGDGIDVSVKPVVELGLGLTILESRTFSWGVVARFDSFASRAVFLTIGPRITWRWGYF
jgi:hypothetical protein